MKRDIKKGLFLLNMEFGGWDICGVFFGGAVDGS